MTTSAETLASNKRKYTKRKSPAAVKEPQKEANPSETVSKFTEAEDHAIMKTAIMLTEIVLDNAGVKVPAVKKAEAVFAMDLFLKLKGYMQ